MPSQSADEPRRVSSVRPLWNETTLGAMSVDQLDEHLVVTIGETWGTVAGDLARSVGAAVLCSLGVAV